MDMRLGRTKNTAAKPTTNPSLQITYLVAGALPSIYFFRVGDPSILSLTKITTDNGLQ